MKEDALLTFKYINENSVLKTLMILFFIISFALGIANNLDIFLVTERLGLDETYYQFFSGIAGIGVILGGIIYVVLSKYKLNMKLLYTLMGISTVTIFLEGYSTITALTMFLQFIDNMIGGILSGYIMSLLTKITDQEYIGKINGFSSTLMCLGIMIGIVVSGFVMKSVSIVFAFFIASIGFLACTFILYKASKNDSFKSL